MELWVAMDAPLNRGLKPGIRVATDQDLERRNGCPA